MHSTLLSAGVLCYSYAESTGDLYFLLGRERASGGPWSRAGCSRWSDFGGAVHDGESDVQCASREFVEETMGLVHLTHNNADADESTCYYTQAQDTEAILRQDNFTLRISLDTNTDRVVSACPVNEDEPQRLRVCYLKRIPWQPDLPDKFDHLKHFLDALAGVEEDTPRAVAYYHSMPHHIQTHPAVVVTRDANNTVCGVSVRREYLEKQQIGWWSLARLETILDNGGIYKNKYCFRIGFLSTLAVVLQHFKPTQVFDTI